MSATPTPRTSVPPVPSREELARLLAAEADGEVPVLALADAALQGMLKAVFSAVGAHEGTVWLLDEVRQELVPRYNSGPNAGTFVHVFRQPLSSGIISLVVATEQPMCENQMKANPSSDPALDERLACETSAMVAVPLYFAGALRGVISAVQLRDRSSADRAEAFGLEAIERMQAVATCVGRLAEHRLLLAISPP